MLSSQDIVRNQDEGKLHFTEFFPKLSYGEKTEPLENYYSIDSFYDNLFICAIHILQYQIHKKINVLFRFERKGITKIKFKKRVAKIILKIEVNF